MAIPSIPLNLDVSILLENWNPPKASSSTPLSILLKFPISETAPLLFWLGIFPLILFWLEFVSPPILINELISLGL